MKIYITSRFKNATENKQDIEALCAAVRAAGHEDFNFIRDIERYDPAHFSSQDDVWREALRTLKECDALLIDVSDAPSGGRNVEAGMAYALGMPVYVVVKRGVEYKKFYEGISVSVIEYDSFAEITDYLKGIL